MKFEIKNDRHGQPHARFSYYANGTDNIPIELEIETGNIGIKELLILVAYIIRYVEGILK